MPTMRISGSLAAFCYCLFLTQATEGAVDDFPTIEYNEDFIDLADDSAEATASPVSPSDLTGAVDDGNNFYSIIQHEEEEDVVVDLSDEDTTAATERKESIITQTIPFMHYPTADEIRESAKASPDMSKPVQVFILMGQSNMVGFGQIEPAEVHGTLEYALSEGKYQHLVDFDDEWLFREDVNVVYRRADPDDPQEWESPLTVSWWDHNFIGPEVQFGHVVGTMIDAPVLILKVGTGNRSLGWDFLPPGSRSYEYDGRKYAGYHECPSSVSPSSSFISGSEKCVDEKSWYAGLQFDRDALNAKAVLDNIDEYVPGYEGQGFEIGGFVFWQGHKDMMRESHATQYRQNMREFIVQMWETYESYPGAKKFVHATIGFHGCNASDRLNNIIYNAQREIDGGTTEAFKGQVMSVDARPFWRDRSVSPSRNTAHYNQNAETYMDVGNILGWGMIDLLQNSTYYEDIVKGTCPLGRH